MRSARLAALLLALVLLAAGCGGGKDDSNGGEGGGGGDAAGAPVRGGTLRMGLEAETGGGWCLQESQLAISGIMVARAIYDTLTAPNAEGEYVPYLAEAVEPNEDFTEWTITVREGVTFHDGTELTAEVVKNNLDAYRGAEGDHARRPLLTLFVFSNIASVEVAGERDVVVTTSVPWVAFPAFLYSSGRLGISAQAQLDSTDACESEPIGTGPFMLDEWVEGRELRTVANPDYWQVAPDGEPYPYLEELVFEPITEAEQRVNSLTTGGIQLAHFSTPDDILALRDMSEDGTLHSHESTANAEVSLIQLNTSRAPFDDRRIREAISLAIDPADYRETISRGVLLPANGIFAPGSPGYVEDTGYRTEGDTARAEELVAEYEAENGELRTISYVAGPNASAQETAAYIQQALEAVGFDIELETSQQDSTVDRAISGDFDMMLFRNYPGGDPDLLTVWFRSGSPVNFGRISDPEIDALLDEARSEPDSEARLGMYEELARIMGEQAYATYLNHSTWLIGSVPEVRGYDPETAPTLPDGGGPYDEGLAAGFPTHGLWSQQG